MNRTGVPRICGPYTHQSPERGARIDPRSKTVCDQLPQYRNDLFAPWEIDLHLGHTEITFQEVKGGTTIFFRPPTRNNHKKLWCKLPTRGSGSHQFHHFRDQKRKAYLKVTNPLGLDKRNERLGIEATVKIKPRAWSESPDSGDWILRLPSDMSING
jgi:hypothetical protein